MIKLADLIKVKRSGCAKCFTLMYSIPCQVDRKLASYMSSFGKPVYPLKAVSFIRIDSGNGYHIEARLNAKVIKFVMPKKFANDSCNDISRKAEFESNLASWMTDKLNMDITV